MLKMVGEKKALEPLRESLILKIKEIFGDFIENNLGKVNNIDEKLHHKIETLISIRLEELSPQDIKNIIKNIIQFKIEKYGLLMGVSRKSWINSIDKSNVNERLGGSLAPVLFSQNQGVDIFRVHDVKETFQAIKVFKRIECSK
jgi:dihydropteroate synthase